MSRRPTVDFLHAINSHLALDDIDNIEARGGSAADFEVDAAAGQLLQLGGSSGAAPPSLGLGIVRLR